MVMIAKRDEIARGVQLMQTPTWQEQFERMRRWHSRISDPPGLTGDSSVDEQYADDVYAFFINCLNLL